MILYYFYDDEQGLKAMIFLSDSNLRLCEYQSYNVLFALIF
jgi:hypothetical protein